MAYQIIATRHNLLPFMMPLSAMSEAAALAEMTAYIDDYNNPYTFPVGLWDMEAGVVSPIDHHVTEGVRKIPINAFNYNDTTYSIPVSASIGDKRYYITCRLENLDEEGDDLEGELQEPDTPDPEAVAGRSYVTKGSKGAGQFFTLPVDAGSIMNAISATETIRTTTPNFSDLRAHLVIDTDLKITRRIGRRTDGSLFLSQYAADDLLGYRTAPDDIDAYHHLSREGIY